MNIILPGIAQEQDKIHTKKQVQINEILYSKIDSHL